MYLLLPIFLSEHISSMKPLMSWQYIMLLVISSPFFSLQIGWISNFTNQTRCRTCMSFVHMAHLQHHTFKHFIADLLMNIFYVLTNISNLNSTKRTIFLNFRHYPSCYYGIIVITDFVSNQTYLIYTWSTDKYLFLSKLSN